MNLFYNSYFIIYTYIIYTTKYAALTQIHIVQQYEFSLF